MAGALEGDVFIGPQAQQYRGLFKINYPLEHGIVTDWDDMERIWQYVYTEELKTVSEDVRQDLMPRSSERLLLNQGMKQWLMRKLSHLIASSSPYGTAAKSPRTS